MHVDALIAVRGIDAEGDQRGAHVMAGDLGGGGVGAVVAEDILLVADLVVLAERAPASW